MEARLDEFEVQSILHDLFPICRSLTGQGNLHTLEYLMNLLPGLQLHSLSSGSQVHDWIIPPEWNIRDAFVMNKHGKKIIDFSSSNLHVVNYSEPIDKIVSYSELLNHLHTLEDYPKWIPYRTSYYHKDWGFCVAHDLLSSEDFVEPFHVYIDADHDPDGHLLYASVTKPGNTEKEILFSTYCCHPSMANDNLSGLVTAVLLFRQLSNLPTYYSYKLVYVLRQLVLSPIFRKITPQMFCLPQFCHVWLDLASIHLKKVGIRIQL